MIIRQFEINNIRQLFMREIKRCCCKPQLDDTQKKFDSKDVRGFHLLVCESYEQESRKVKVFICYRIVELIMNKTESRALLISDTTR